MSLLLAGCSTLNPGPGPGTGGGTGADGGADGGGGGDDGADGGTGTSSLAGHKVQCCYGATTENQLGGTQIVNVCEIALGQAISCIDPSEFDSNLNGTLEFSGELEAFCDVKCAWIGQKYSNEFPWGPEPGNEVAWQQSQEVYGCKATPSTKILDMNSCTPQPPSAYGSPAEKMPTQDFAGSTSDQGNAVELVVDGTSVALDATLLANFALYDCDPAGIDGGQCSFVFTMFDLSLASPVTNGDVVATDASLSLAQVDEATVQFQSCVRGKCAGNFVMSVANGNPLGVDLVWTQTQTSTGSVAHGGLNLSHEPGALGGIGKVVGTIVLDQASPTEGDLRLQATGSDALGGSIAQIDIDLTGVVSRF